METATIKTPGHPKTNSNQRIKGIEAHHKISQHLEQASKDHLTAAKYLEAGNEELAMQNTLKAQAHLIYANELQRENIKRYLLAD